MRIKLICLTCVAYDMGRKRDAKYYESKLKGLELRKAVDDARAAYKKHRDKK